MRFWVLRVWAGAGVLLVATSAGATGGVGGKGDTGGKGGNGPEPGGQPGGGELPPDAPQLLGGVLEKVGEHPRGEKPWEVSVSLETHHLLQENYIAEGLGQVKTFNVLDLEGNYFVTPEDRIRLTAAAFQYFLADANETGFRMDDVELEYSHVFKLPLQVRLRAALALTAPLSFDSQLASNITAPVARLKAIRIFGDFLLAASVSARDYIDRYSSTDSVTDPGGGGNPNVHWRFAGTFEAEYDLPFFRSITVGAAVTDIYRTFYGVGAPPYDSMYYGAVSDPQYGTSQPIQQSYGEQVYVRYVLPDMSGFTANVVATLANGDPTFGYPSVLNDGIQHPYFLYYNTTELYLALEGAY